MSLCDLDAVEQRRLIGTKEISPVELLESTLERIDKVNGQVNAIVAMDVENAKADAKEAEKAVMDGEDLGILHGLPVGIKDLEATAGLRTTYGSLLYENHVPDADVLSVENVREEGAIILAKTNTPEFGAGANTRNRVYGATGNPFNTDLTPAGSSGGSAAALACGMVSLASGSDYGGSLRTPAGYCGIVGFRPSPGLVPVPHRPVALTPYSVSPRWVDHSLGPNPKKASVTFMSKDLAATKWPPSWITIISTMPISITAVVIDPSCFRPSS